MSYHLRVATTLHEKSIEVWRIENNTAIRVGVTNPEGGVGTYYKADLGESIWDTLHRLTTWLGADGRCPFHQTVLRPGEYTAIWHAFAAGAPPIFARKLRYYADPEFRRPPDAEIDAAAASGKKFHGYKALYHHQPR